MGMDNFGVVPDIYVFAKGISGGYAPLAGMAIGEHITGIFQEKKAEFRHLYTFSANPLSCAIGDEVLRIIIEENLIERVNKLEKYLFERLKPLTALPIVGNVRGKGLLWSVEFVKDRKSKEPFPKQFNLKMKVIMGCLSKGVFFYPGYLEDEMGDGDNIMISPPFVIKEEEIDFAVGVLSSVLEAITMDIKANS